MPRPVPCAGHARPERRRRPDFELLRIGALFLVEEPRIRHLAGVPDEHLLQHVGNDLGTSDGQLLVQHLRRHPLCLQLPEQHRFCSRHLGGQPALLVGRGALPDRPPAPDPAGVLRSDRTGPGGDRPECAGQQRERAAQHLRRVRQFHRGGVPQGRRHAARLLGSHRVRPRHQGHGAGLPRPPAALRRIAAGERQFGILRRFRQQGRHAPDQPDLRRREVETRDGRCQGGYRLRGGFEGNGSLHDGRPPTGPLRVEKHQHDRPVRTGARQLHLHLHRRRQRDTVLEPERVPDEPEQVRLDHLHAEAVRLPPGQQLHESVGRLPRLFVPDGRGRPDVLHQKRPSVGGRPRDEGHRPAGLQQGGRDGRDAPPQGAALLCVGGL